METAVIISAALTGIDLLTKSIMAANNGDEDAAKAFLLQAREHFSASVDAWDAGET